MEWLSRSSLIVFTLLKEKELPIDLRLSEEIDVGSSENISCHPSIYYAEQVLTANVFDDFSGIKGIFVISCLGA